MANVANGLDAESAVHAAHGLARQCCEDFVKLTVAYRAGGVVFPEGEFAEPYIDKDEFLSDAFERVGALGGKAELLRELLHRVGQRFVSTRLGAFSYHFGGVERSSSSAHLAIGFLGGKLVSDVCSEHDSTLHVADELERMVVPNHRNKVGNALRMAACVSVFEAWPKLEIEEFDTRLALEYDAALEKIGADPLGDGGVIRLPGIISTELPSPPDDPPAVDDESFFGHRHWANKFDVDPEQLRKRLERWRTANRGSTGYFENPNPGAGKSRFLYRGDVVRPIVEDLKTSGTRPDE